MKVLLILLLFFATFAAGAYFYTSAAQNTPLQHQDESLAGERQQVPEHITYWFLFHHLSVLQKQSDEKARQGKNDLGSLSRFKDQTQLDDAQFQILMQIALNCESEASKLDKQAYEIIKIMHAKHPDGVIPSGEKIPVLPEDLNDLQQQRNQLVLRSRDNLRDALGEEGFANLQSAVVNQVKVAIEPTNH